MSGLLFVGLSAAAPNVRAQRRARDFAPPHPAAADARRGLARAPPQIEWVQTARFKDGSTTLLQDMTPLKMEELKELPKEKTLEIDTSRTYQELLGFGGAFTEASAINWRKLTKEQQDEVIKLYFASPEEGGHGYTLGRVPSARCAPPAGRAARPPARPWLPAARRDRRAHRSRAPPLATRGPGVVGVRSELVRL